MNWKSFQRFGNSISSLYATRRFNEILLHAVDEAGKFKDEYVGVTYISCIIKRKEYTIGTCI